MIKMLINDIFSPYSSFGERFAAFLLLILFGAVAVLLSALVFAGVDSFGISATQQATTRINDLRVIPAHTTTTMILVGKVFIPVTTHHPESYRVHFEIEHYDAQISIEKEVFDTLEVGQDVRVDFGQTRLTGHPKPVRLRP